MITRKDLQDILSYLKKYRETLPSNTSNIKKTNFCIDILERFENNYDEWIRRCPVSNQTISHYISLKYIQPEGIRDEFYLSCAKFLREFIFYLQRIESENVWLDSDWSTFKNEAYGLIQPEYHTWLDYIINGQFDIDILNYMLGDKSYQAFLNYENNVKEAEYKSDILEKNLTEKIAQLESFLQEKTITVNQLAELLKEQKAAFNFVGLSKGFDKLRSQKNCAKWTSFGLMSIIGLVSILLPTIFIGTRFLNWFSEYNIDWNKVGWEQMLPVIGLEFILIYFFRVVLNHYNSIQTQIMQIDLRQALCQFIQNYVEYAKEIKEKDKDALEKFENLIFSSILSTPDKVPSTFDGVDQFANFIKEIKKNP